LWFVFDHGGQQAVVQHAGSQAGPGQTGLQSLAGEVPGRGREDGEGAPHGASGRHADGDTDPTKDLAAASAATQQRVAAAKSYIEQHYKQQMKILKERKDR